MTFFGSSHGAYGECIGCDTYPSSSRGETGSFVLTDTAASPKKLVRHLFDIEMSGLLCFCSG